MVSCKWKRRSRQARSGLAVAGGGDARTFSSTLSARPADRSTFTMAVGRVSLAFSNASRVRYRTFTGTRPRSAT